MSITENGQLDGPVVITNREIYNELLQVKGVVQIMGGQATQLGDHENRIRKLEAWRYALPSTLILALASLASAILIPLLGGTHG